MSNARILSKKILRIRKKFLEHRMRNEDLDKLTHAGYIEGKRDRRKHRENYVTSL